MMPEPPGSGVYLSARGRRTRSAVREYPPQRRPLTSEIGCGYCRRFRHVKGVEISVDESARDEARVLPGERSTPMIRIGKVKVRAARCPSLASSRRGKSTKRGCALEANVRIGPLKPPGCVLAIPRAGSASRGALTACRPERRPHRARLAAVTEMGTKSRNCDPTPTQASAAAVMRHLQSTPTPLGGKLQEDDQLRANGASAIVEQHSRP
jgi:hypothetical protein